jgi:phage terminase large subunit-like protein
MQLGSQPRQLITTTPRPTALLKRLICDPSSVTTHANAFNLAPTFPGACFRVTLAYDWGGKSSTARSSRMPRERRAAAAPHRSRGRSAGVE